MLPLYNHLEGRVKQEIKIIMTRNSILEQSLHVDRYLKDIPIK